VSSAYTTMTARLPRLALITSPTNDTMNQAKPEKSITCPKIAPRKILGGCSGISLEALGMQ
jgi:hypothetical protein